MLIRLLVGLVDLSRRYAVIFVLGGILLAAFAGWFASAHLGVSTDTDLMFSDRLPWRQRAAEMNKDFPQFRDLLVAVVDARIPEEADATAAELARRIGEDMTHFRSVRRPDSSPFLAKEGLLFLQPKQLSDLMDQTIDAQPFLGQLVADPSARGLFAALSLLGVGVTPGGRRFDTLPAADPRLPSGDGRRHWTDTRSHCRGKACSAADSTNWPANTGSCWCSRSRISARCNQAARRPR